MSESSDCIDGGESMSRVFPRPIVKLPLADIPLVGARGYLSQSTGHQVVFMEFAKDVELPEHAHESQWGVVLEGRIDLVMNGERFTFRKGD
jgi:mannose-6-phosphate isomerase-like protein (cupin superfamily)